jgi:hypothetical protein
MLSLRRGAHIQWTGPAHWPYSAALARAGAALYVSVSVPLLPARMRSLRGASVFLTSPKVG